MKDIRKQIIEKVENELEKQIIVGNIDMISINLDFLMSCIKKSIAPLFEQKESKGSADVELGRMKFSDVEKIIKQVDENDVIGNHGAVYEVVCIALEEYAHQQPKQAVESPTLTDEHIDIWADKTATETTGKSKHGHIIKAALYTGAKWGISQRGESLREELMEFERWAFKQGYGSSNEVELVDEYLNSRK